MGNPKDFTREDAHKGVLGLLVMKGRYRDVVRIKEVTGDDYRKVESLSFSVIESCKIIFYACNENLFYEFYDFSMRRS